MKMGRGMRFLFVAIVLFFVSSNAWAVLTCGDKTTALLAGEFAVMHMASVDNAHAELPTQSNYLPPTGRIVYCTESSPGVTFTMEVDSILDGDSIYQLAQPTNSHTEVPGGGNYLNTIVSLVPNTGTISVNVAVGFNPCTPGFVPIVRLSDLTNAHVQSAYNTPQTYPVTICASYSSGSGPPTEDILVTQPLSPPPVALDSVTGSHDITITTTNLVNGNANYTALEAFQTSVICDKAKPLCASADSYDEFAAEIGNFLTASPYTGFLIPATMEANIYDDSNPTTIYYNNIYLLYQSKGVAPQIKPGIHNTPSATDIYTINPAALSLPPGSYRFLTIQAYTNYSYTAAFPNLTESPAFATLNNFKFTDFTVVDGGSGPGPGPEGSGGDVYLIKKISFTPSPPVEGGDFSVVLEVQNKHTDIPQTLDSINHAIVDIIIRDGKGNPIAGDTPTIFADNEPVTFTVPASGTVSDATLTIPIELSSAQNPALVPGETFTLYASIKPFEDPTPAPTDESETIIGNNATFQTFTIIKPQPPISVPDAPWWMSMVFVSAVMGWLFLSTRNEKGKELGRGRGKFAFHK